MTYNEAFPLWVAEVYRNHGYEPDTWYGSEVAEKMHKETLATYKGPPATMWDYVEAIPSEEEFEYAHRITVYKKDGKTVKREVAEYDQWEKKWRPV